MSNKLSKADMTKLQNDKTRARVVKNALVSGLNLAIEANDRDVRDRLRLGRKKFEEIELLITNWRKIYARTRDALVETRQERDHCKQQYGVAIYYLDYVKTVLEGKTMYKSKEERIEHAIQALEQVGAAMVQAEEEFQKQRKTDAEEADEASSSEDKNELKVEF